MPSQLLSVKDAFAQGMMVTRMKGGDRRSAGHRGNDSGDPRKARAWAEPRGAP